MCGARSGHCRAISSRLKERMSVNSISTRVLPSSGPGAQTAQPPARAQGLPQRAYVDASPTQIAGIHVTGADFEAARSSPGSPSGEATDAGEFQNTLEQALRQGRATAGNATVEGGASEAPRKQPSPGIAVYQRVSQYSSGELSTSALLERWNRIMQTGEGAGGAAADLAKAFAQNESPGIHSGVIDLTA